MILFLLFAMLSGQANAPTSALQQGLVAMRDGNLEEAKAKFETALQQDPKNAFAWVSLAEASRRLGNSAVATDAARKAEQFGIDLPAVDHALASFYTQQDQFAHAAALEEKYAGSPQADSKAAPRAAELYERAQDIVGAERVLKHAWERQKTDPDSAFNYANLLLLKLKFVDAEQIVTPALAAHPADVQLILVAGVTQYGERRFHDAMDQFLKIISIDPNIPQPYLFLGKMLEQAGPKLPEITKAFEARVGAAPDDALAALVLAKAKLMSNSKDPAAENLLRHSIAINGEQWEAHYQLGVMLETAHNFKSAEEELSRSIALDAKQAMPHYHLARVYDRLGEPERAQAERKLHESLSDIPK